MSEEQAIAVVETCPEIVSNDDEVNQETTTNLEVDVQEMASSSSSSPSPPSTSPLTDEDEETTSKPSEDETSNNERAINVSEQHQQQDMGSHQDSSNSKLESDSIEQTKNVILTTRKKFF